MSKSVQTSPLKELIFLRNPPSDNSKRSTLNNTHVLPNGLSSCSNGTSAVLSEISETLDAINSTINYSDAIVLTGIQSNDKNGSVIEPPTLIQNTSIHSDKLSDPLNSYIVHSTSKATQSKLDTLSQTQPDVLSQSQLESQFQSMSVTLSPIRHISQSETNSGDIILSE
eukprot:880293_1